MAVIQVNYDQPDKMTIPEKDNVILLCDYKSYFDPNYRHKLLFDKSASGKIDPSHVCSPFEAIAAYIKSRNPDIEGDVQVIDLEGDICHAATINFTAGRYSLNKDSICRDVPLIPLFERYFNYNYQDIKAFDQFLEQPDPNGATIGYSVAKAIREQSNGDKRYNKLMEVFDQKLWADIEIDHILAFKNEIARQLSIDLQKSHYFFGLLGSVLSGTYEPTCRIAKLQGAAQLQQYGASFYAAAATNVKIKVHSYPDDKDLYLVPADTPYEEYIRPKKLPVLYAGAITLYIGNHPVDLTCDHQVFSNTELFFYQDGNQHIWATIGEKSYLL
ncbi:hypothetical protein [Chitinophaga sp. S165]|uniref:hypothetical protein n=1 Tax=Chitinophaga sp. S165 TaxID=2135462 RepID=UPI000D712F2A|nr:hypothetical protein [Chitinophaga sp. S165]PWV45819.1 hypothetical protein C7475_11236 [Chitinophaga sp. S165]